MTSSPDIDALLASVKSAARALIENPQRSGSLIRLEGEDVIVTGDLHGDVAAFNRIVEITDLASHPGRHLILQELIHENGKADVCSSCLLIERTCTLINRWPGRVHVLLGNHEMAELTGRAIIKNGAVLNEAFSKGVVARYGARAEEAMMYFQALWRSMALAARTPNRVFISHSTPAKDCLPGVEERSPQPSSALSGPDRSPAASSQATAASPGSEKAGTGHFSPGVLERRLEPHDMQRGGSGYELVWGRDFCKEAADRFAEMVDADFLIVGHTPCPEGFAVPNHRHVVLDSQGPAGVCLLLEMQAPLTLEEIVGKILPLWP